MAELSPVEVAAKGNSNVKCDIVSHSNLISYLSSAYEVLRRVFSYLCLDDFMNAAEAFDSWKAVADVIRKERCLIESFFVTNKRNTVSQTWSEAIFSICFYVSPNPELEGRVQKFLSPAGEAHLCHSESGVIGTADDITQTLQLKIGPGGIKTSASGNSYANLRIPNFSNVGIKAFVWEEGTDFVEFQNNFDIPSEKQVKCVLILMVSEDNERITTLQMESFLNFLSERQSEPFAVGGCVVDDLANTRATDSHSVIKYIVMYGDNVEAASTVLTEEINTLSAIDNKVKQFKESVPVCDKGVLFVFTCAGRQRVFMRSRKHHKDIKKWESDTLSKYFPNTPTVGCYGYGEFGRDHPSNCDVPQIKKQKLGQNCQYSFSTSVVYVAFRT